MKAEERASGVWFSIIQNGDANNMNEILLVWMDKTWIELYRSEI